MFLEVVVSKGGAVKAVFYPVSGRKSASSRYRAWLLADHREEFVVGYPGDGRWRRFDAVVLQKQTAGWAERVASRARRARKFVVADFSDVHLFRKAKLMGRVGAVAAQAHAVTCSNGDDMRYLSRKLGRTVTRIRNAQNMKAYAHKKVHGPKKRPVVLWMGHSNNAKVLDVVWPALRSLAAEGVGFQVLLVSDSSEIVRGRHIDERHPVWFEKWKLKHINRIMLRGDVAVNPQTRKWDGLWHKERNKTVTAWACGLPCVDFVMARTDHALWRKWLRDLILDYELRDRVGKSGVRKAGFWGVRPVSLVWLDMLTKGVKRCQKR